MQQLPNSPIRFQLGLRGWISVVVGLAMFAALTALVSLLALGIFIIAVPLFILAPLVLHLRRKNALAMIIDPHQESLIVPKSQPAIIEGTFSQGDQITSKKADDL
jgi:hypothetical protein